MDASNKADKPGIIANTEVGPFCPKVDKRTWLEETLEDHFHCILCGSDLAFTHKTDFVTQVVTEDANCACCKIRNRQSSHRLQ